MIGEGMRMVE
jgi:hypothetical protein